MPYASVRFCAAFLKFELAFDKAQYAQEVTWIGVMLLLEQRSITATISEEKVAELLELVNGTLN